MFVHHLGLESMRQNALDAALDRSIYFSFDRSGFERHTRAFRAAEVDVNRLSTAPSAARAERQSA
jgi:hypothetical protein